MALTTQFVKLKLTGISISGTEIRCIKDFPDIDPHGNPDQVEVTTLCDEYHQYIDGLKNYADDLEFTANYNETVFGTINGISEYSASSTYAVGDLVRHENVIYKCSTAIATAEAWNSTHWTAVTVELLLCESQSDVAGKNGKFSIAKADLSVRLSGGGVGDAMEMVYIVKPKGSISFETVA